MTKYQPQCTECPLGQYFRALPPTNEVPGEPGGWECQAQNDKFIPEWDAPDECPYLVGYNTAPPHPLAVALRRRNERAAVVWLRENVPAVILRAACKMEVSSERD